MSLSSALSLVHGTGEYRGRALLAGIVLHTLLATDARCHTERGVVAARATPRVGQKAKLWQLHPEFPFTICPLRGDIRKNWNDTEKISMAPAQG